MRFDPVDVLFNEDMTVPVPGTDNAALREALSSWSSPQAVYVADHGDDFTVDRAQVGERNECFYNAWVYCLENDGARYVEGYAVADRVAAAWAEGGPHAPALWHAWVIGSDGEPLEVTWAQPGTAYVGVELGAFTSATLLMMRAGVIYPALPTVLKELTA